MSIHANSRSAYDSLDLPARDRAVLEAYSGAVIGLTDRDVMTALGSMDPNFVRPSITRLVKRGVLFELGSLHCEVTGRRVRVCRPLVEATP